MKLTIASRLLVMIAGSIAALLLVGALGFYSTRQVTNDLKYTNENIISNLNTLARAENTFLVIRVNALYFLSYDDPAKKAPHEEVIKQKIQEVNSLLGEYEKKATDNQDKSLLDADKQSFANYTQILEKVLERSRANDREGMNAVVENEWKPAGGKLTTAFQEHAAFNNDLATKIVKNATQTGRRNNILTLIALATGIVLTSGIGLLLRRNISASLHTMRTTMLHVAGQLDFTARANIHTHDEIGVTATAFNQLLDRVQGNIRSVAAGAGQVAQAASQMAQTAAQVAAASFEQSEAASNMASSIEQMSVSIGQVGDRAGEVHHFSSESGKLAKNGEEVIGHTVEEINNTSGIVSRAADHIRQLEEQSLQISSVVAVIKEVADQTNLLALNAAIEAARAGEQGRGFAVVADEVRKLAERTASSTQEITRTIASMRNGARNAVEGMQHIVRQVTSSVERVSIANKVMEQIGHGSRNGVAMVDEIVNAIREQGSASNSIALQIEHIAQMAEEGSCAANEGAQSARELDQLAIGMQQMVAAYRL
ncbi:MAG: HAMP domain-containing methyl-accepting chemotaxis protein [Formivibrio sp.]|nr:HAMP domain-containing methyl-accepting chemotaxis protein [Formivibrio sp.]